MNAITHVQMEKYKLDKIVSHVIVKHVKHVEVTHQSVWYVIPPINYIIPNANLTALMDFMTLETANVLNVFPVAKHVQMVIHVIPAYLDYTLLKIHVLVSAYKELMVLTANARPVMWHVRHVPRGQPMTV